MTGWFANQTRNLAGFFQNEERNELNDDHIALAQAHRNGRQPGIFEQQRTPIWWIMPSFP